MSEGDEPAPGWYESPDGRGLRYWDGSAWTDHRRAHPEPSSTHTDVEDDHRDPAAQPGPQSRVLIAAGLALAVAIGFVVLAIMDDGDDAQQVASSRPAETEGESTVRPPDEPPATATSMPSAEPPVASPSVEEFSGTVPSDRPALREVELQAGEALRMTVVPSRTGAASELAIAVALDDATAATWLESGEPFPRRFLDADNFFSDFYSSSLAGVPVNILRRTAYYFPPGDDPLSLSGPPNYFVYGRGWGAANDAGTWLQFVAPAEATYTLLISGYGDFDVVIERAPVRPDVLATIDSGSDSESFDQGPDPLFPYEGDAWLTIVESHLSFFFDEAFFRPEQFFSDYFSDDDGFTPGEDRPYGPTPEIRAEVQSIIDAGRGG